MTHPALRTAIFTACCCTGLAAQNTTTLFPATANSADGSGGLNTAGFARRFNGVPVPARQLTVLNGAALVQAGLPNGPVLIHRISFRADNNSTFTWAGATDPALTLDLSSATTAPGAGSLQLDANHGADRRRVFSGPAIVPPGTASGDGTPGPKALDLSLPQPFLFFTGQRLVVDLVFSGDVPASGWAPSFDAENLGTSEAQTLATVTLFPPFTSTLDQPGIAPVMEIEWSVPTGLLADFAPDTTSGLSPLTVNFTSLSVTDDPGGFTAREWDFDGDGTIDATGATASFTYGCGGFDVSHTVRDSLNGSVTITKPGLIQTDLLSLTATRSNRVTDLATPVDFRANTDPAAAVAWDFDGDGTVDSTALEPSHTYATVGSYTASVTATLNCRTLTETLDVLVVPELLNSPLNSGSQAGGETVCYLDLDVLAPQGIVVEGLRLQTSGGAGSPTVQIYGLGSRGVSTAGREARSNYTLLASAVATNLGQGAFTGDFYADLPDFSLPPGLQGLAITTTAPEQLLGADSLGLLQPGTSASLTLQGSNLDFEQAIDGSVEPRGLVGGLALRPADGLVAGMQPSISRGLSPLTVLFQDTSVTDDPGGVTSWAWDFDSDGTIDSTAQNPTHTYATCGSYTVTLQVTDAGRSDTLVATDLIQTDTFALDLDALPLLASVGVATELRAGVPPGVSVGWDLDSDGTVDLSGNPVQAVFNTLGPTTVTATAIQACRVQQLSADLEVIPESTLSIPRGPNGDVTGLFFGGAAVLDIQVLRPEGILLRELLLPIATTDGTSTVEIQLRTGSVLDAQGTLPLGLVGTIVFPNPNVFDANDRQGPPLLRVDIPDVVLPAGVSGLAINGVISQLYVADDGAGISTGNGDLIATPRGTSGILVPTTPGFPNSFGFYGQLIYEPLAPGEAGVFGGGCPGPLGQSTIQVLTPPTVGQLFSFSVDNVGAGGVIVHGGVSRTLNPQFGLPLPFNLSPLLALTPNCFFQVSSEVILPTAFPDPQGVATVALPIPNNPLFQGLTAFFQGLVFDPNALGSIVLSDAWAGRVQ